MNAPALLLLIGWFSATPAGLPDPAMTPGALNPAVRQDNIETTICALGWSAATRPPLDYTEALKRQQIAQYGYRDRRLRDYEEDHLVPISLGGAPADARNLWPQPRHPRNHWGAARKDELEFRLHDLVCGHRLALRAAQRAIAGNWIDAYRRFMQ